MVGPVAVIGWSVGFCYICGLRGFFALDQSIVFDGAWRVLHGQTPYRDFLFPFGPMVLWLQAAMFALFGVTYRVYVLTAAALNGIGAILAYVLIRRLIPERRWLALAAGFLTGTWLYAPMGTTYPEQTGFIAVLSSVTAVVAGLKSSHSQRRWLWMVVAGASLGVAVMCKTNAGIFGVLAVLAALALMLQRPLKAVLGDWLAIGIGTGIIFASFALWLWTKSDPTTFRYAVFQLAGEQGAGRLFSGGFRHALSGLATGKGNDLLRIVTLTCITLLTLGLAAALNGCERDAVKAERLRILGVLALALVGFQNLFSLSSSNNGTNEVPFVGLIWVFAVEAFLIVRASGKEPNEWMGMGRHWIKGILVTALIVTALMWPRHKNMIFLVGAAAGLLIAWFGRWYEKPDYGLLRGPSQARPWVIGVFWVMLVALGGLGVAVGYQRNVQDIFNSKTRYVAHKTIPALLSLRWAEGVKPGEAHANWSDFESVFQELRDSKGQFYVVGDYTILYGVVGRPSVGPLLWFHKGLTYASKYDANQDQRLAQAVDRPEVTVIVVEEATFMNTSPLVDFPILQKVISEQYHPTKQCGLFKLYRRNEASQE